MLTNIPATCKLKTVWFLLVVATPCGALLQGCGPRTTTSADGKIVRREGDPDVVKVGGEDVQMNLAIQTARKTLPIFIKPSSRPRPVKSILP